MKHISFFQIIILSVFSALAIAAVLIFAFAVGGSANNTVGQVTIWGTLDGTAFNTVIRQALEKDTRLSQVVYVQKSKDTYARDVTNALASGEGPDLFLLTQDQAYSDSSKLIVIPYTSVSRAQYEDTFVDAAEPFLAESGVLAVPLSVDPLVMYWNKDLLSSAGFSKPPLYWDELYDMARKITKRSESGAITKSAIDFGEYVNVNNAKDVFSLLTMQAGGSITTRDSTGRIISAISPKTGDATQATASALRFYTEFADPSKEGYTWNRSLPEARQVFGAGDLALYIGYASERALVARTNPNLNFAVAPVPQIRGSERVSNFGKVYAFAIPRTTQNANGAVTIASALSATENSAALSIALGMPSARRDVLAAAATDDDETARRAAIISRTWIDPDPEKTAEVFRDMIENTTSGAMLLTEAVQRADQEMSQILGL